MTEDIKLLKDRLSFIDESIQIIETLKSQLARELAYNRISRYSYEGKMNKLNVVYNHIVTLKKDLTNIIFLQNNT